MAKPKLCCPLVLPVAFPPPTFATVLLVAILLVLARSAQAQTFTILHNFTGGIDGADFATLIWPTCARLIWPTFID
jgi:hypothetical protein